MIMIAKINVMTGSMKLLGFACVAAGIIAALPWTSAQAVTAVATVNVNIISTIALTTRNGLMFGEISPGSAAGTVTITSGNARASTGGASINSSVAGSPATFDVQGVSSASYTISLPASVVLADASSQTMVVDNFTSTPTPAGVLDSSGQQSLFVGATLNVNSNQAFGEYSGQMSVTVDYN